VFFGLVAWGVSAIVDVKNSIAYMAYTQEMQSKSAIVVDNGVVAEVATVTVTPENNIDSIAQAMQGLIVDRDTVTLNYTQSEFNDALDLVKNAPYLERFLDEYVIISTGKTQEYTQIEKSAFGYFKSYVENLRDMVKLNTLPHEIRIKDYEYDEDKDFKSDGKKFTLKVTFKVSMKNYKQSDEKWYSSTGDVIVEMGGFLDHKTKTKRNKTKGIKGVNGLGIHPEWFSVTYPDISQHTDQNTIYTTR
jgi:hypothetical protein